VQSQQLPTESEVFEDEVLAGAKRADDPPEEMPERHNHGKNITGTIRIQLCAKSLILQMYDVLAKTQASVSVTDVRATAGTMSHFSDFRGGFNRWTQH